MSHGSQCDSQLTFLGIRYFTLTSGSKYVHVNKADGNAEARGSIIKCVFGTVRGACSFGPFMTNMALRRGVGNSGGEQYAQDHETQSAPPLWHNGSATVWNCFPQNWIKSVESAWVGVLWAITCAFITVTHTGFDSEAIIFLLPLTLHFKSLYLEI